MNAMKFCPDHGKASTLRTTVHTKGCPGAKTDCVDTCYPRTWFYCTQCDWRRRVEPLKGVSETEELRAVARAGRKIWRLRREVGLTTRELAEAAGLSWAFISFIECGRASSTRCGDLIRILVDAKRKKEKRGNELERCSRGVKFNLSDNYQGPALRSVLEPSWSPLKREKKRAGASA